MIGLRRIRLHGWIHTFKLPKPSLPCIIDTNVSGINKQLAQFTYKTCNAFNCSKWLTQPKISSPCWSAKYILKKEPQNKFLQNNNQFYQSLIMKLNYPLPDFLSQKFLQGYSTPNPIQTKPNDLPLSSKYQSSFFNLHQ